MPDLGVFIDIQIDEGRLPADIAATLVPLCPVEIFMLEDGRLIVRPDQVDECTLCELCLAIAPPGAITIRKKYKDEQLVSRGVQKQST